MFPTKGSAPSRFALQPHWGSPTPSFPAPQPVHSTPPPFHSLYLPPILSPTFLTLIFGI